MTQISMKVRMTALAALFAFCTMMMASTGAMAANSAKSQKSAFIQGTSAAGDQLNGVLTITSFVNQSGQLVAQGILNGTLTSATGAGMTATNGSPSMFAK